MFEVGINFSINIFNFKINAVRDDQFPIIKFSTSLFPNFSFGYWDKNVE